MGFSCCGRTSLLLAWLDQKMGEVVSHRVEASADTSALGEIERRSPIICPVFRDQDLTPDQHKAIGRRLRELHVHLPAAPSVAGHPEVMISAGRRQLRRRPR